MHRLGRLVQLYTIKTGWISVPLRNRLCRLVQIYTIKTGQISVPLHHRQCRLVQLYTIKTGQISVPLHHRLQIGLALHNKDWIDFCTFTPQTVQFVVALHQRDCSLVQLYTLQTGCLAYLYNLQTRQVCATLNRIDCVAWSSFVLQTPGRLLWLSTIEIGQVCVGLYCTDWVVCVALYRRDRVG